MADANLNIKVNDSEGSDAVTKFAKNTTSQLEKLEKKFSNISLFTGISAGIDVAKVAVAGFGKAANALISTLTGAAQAAAEQEQAMQKLAVSLKLSGDFSEKAVSQFKALADKLESTTGIDDSAILNVISMGKSLGLTNEQAEKLATTSVDLAAITGQDLNSAADDLAKTFNGFTKGLSKTNPELKNLTTEALANGAALDIIAGKFGGAAAAMTQTFGGAVKLAGTQFNNLQESIGGLITKNPIVIAAIAQLGVLFGKIAKIIEDNRDVLIDLINKGFLALVGIIPTVIRGLQTVDDVVTGISQTFKKSQSLFADAFGKLTGVGKNVAEIEKERKETEESNKSLVARKKILEDIAKVSDGYVAKVKEVSTQQISATKATQKLANAEVKASEQRIDAIQRVIAAERERVREFQRGEIAKVAQGGALALLDKPVVPDGVKATDKDQKDLETKRAAAGGLSVVNTALKGAQGAAQFISSAVGRIADTFLPGVGGIVSEIVSVLAQGPDKVREMVDGFVGAIPTIIENIVNALPVLIERLVIGLTDAAVKVAEKLPELVDKLIEGLLELLQNEEFITALVITANKLAITLSAQAPFIAQSLSIALIKEAPNIAVAIAKASFEAIKEQFKTGGGLLGGGGGAGGGGVLGGVKKIFGFADGGRVPGGAPYTDRVPALLTPDEIVLNRDTSKILTDLLSGGANDERIVAELKSLKSALGKGGNGGNFNLNVNMADKKVAGAFFDINNRGFRTAPA